MLPQPNQRGAYAARLNKQKLRGSKEEQEVEDGTVSESRIGYSGFGDRLYRGETEIRKGHIPDMG